MSKLILYLKGNKILSTDITIPEYDDLPFKDRCIARTEYVEAKAVEFKLMYLRQIIKVEFDYCIELYIDSSFCKQVHETII